MAEMWTPRTRSVKIEVTKDDIRNGQARNAQACAIARAVKRVTGQAYVFVSPSITIDHAGTGISRTYAVSPRVRRFILRFDTLPHCWPFVRPFSFELPIEAR